MPNQKNLKFCQYCGHKIKSPRFYCPVCGNEIEDIQDNSDYKEIFRNAISLTIEDAGKSYSWRNIVEIYDDCMRQINVRKGDKVVLLGNKISAGVVKRSRVLNKTVKPVRIKALMRSNLGKDIGESIKLYKIKPKIAKEITLIPYYNHRWFNTLSENQSEISKLIRKRYSKFPLAKYDKIFLSSIRELGSYLCIVVSMKPTDICILNENTKVNVIKIHDVINFKTVVNTYKHVLSIDSKDVDILLSLSKMYAQEENYIKILFYLDRILSIQPKHLFALISKANIIFAHKEFEKAIVSFEEALQLYPNYEKNALLRNDSNLKEILNSLGTCYARLGNYQLALDYFKTLIKSNPKFKLGLINLGYCYYKIGNSEEAISCINRALKINFLQTPEGSDLKRIYSYTHSLAKHREKSDKLLKDFNSLDISALKILGEIYFETKNYEEAKENYLLALKKAPKDPEIWLNLGFIFLQRKDLIEAEKHLKMALKINPGENRARFILAEVYYQTQNYSAALKLADEVMKITPNDKEILDFREKIRSKLK